MFLFLHPPSHHHRCLGMMVAPAPPPSPPSSTQEGPWRWAWLRSTRWVGWVKWAPAAGKFMPVISNYPRMPVEYSVNGTVHSLLLERSPGRCMSKMPCLALTSITISPLFPTL
jgi:hypothetical protein